ncbi:MAG: RNA-binding protein [SAR202 cluster bacterium]|nr:RNA-binding protein [SAR202 cluster bacterium]
MRIYVGNLPYEMAEEELQRTFSAYGQVESATVIRDRQTGRSKGFGFVEMPAASEAKAAIEALNGKQINSRALTVNEARPREERGGGGGGFGGGRGGQGGGQRRY